jgi:CubicO group peptidase (beta-lactamase class C family)
MTMDIPRDPREVSRARRRSALAAAFRIGFPAVVLAVGAVLAIRLGPTTVAEDLPEPRTPLPDSVWADRILEYAEDAGPLNSLIVSQNDTIRYEYYFRGMHRHRKVNIKSASKTVMATLIGVAIREGFIDSLTAPLSAYLPEYFEDLEPGKKQITLEHLITMTTGLEGTSFENYDPWVLSRDWARFALEQPIIAEPGAQMDYSTGSTHLLSIVLTKATGMSTLAFARKYLFGPLGGSLQTWDRDPQGYYLGGNNMAVSPMELLSIGEMYLHGGERGGQRFLDPEWIEEAWRVRTSSPHTGAGYGYGWWHRRMGGYDVWYALGYGGQYLFVIPDLHVAIAATSALGTRRGRGSRSAMRLVSRVVIPAVEDHDRMMAAAALPAAPAVTGR